VIVVTNNRTTGRLERRHVCHSCELLRINGVVCHETGCPDAWQDAVRKCKWCGQPFTPEHRNQVCCSEGEDSCAQSYHS
jgi:hypothetical protein